MPTVVLNAYSKAYPLITNRIRASVFLQSDPTALIAIQIDTTPEHPARTWSFPGLPRNNYGFSLDEINSSGDTVSNLALFSVVPGEIDGELVRDDEQIKVGTTIGFIAGAKGFVFDGTPVGDGTLAIAFQGDTSSTSSAFTLSGIPSTGDVVLVHFEVNPNDTDPIEIYNISSTVLTGWSLSDLITDLYNKMLAVWANTFTYTNSGNNGVRVQGFSSSSITVTLTPASSGFKPNYIGWEIVPSELTGRGILVKGLDYSWNSTTGEFNLLQEGDILEDGNYYNIHFNPILNPAGSSYPTVTDFSIRLITSTESILLDDFANKVIIEPVADYIEVTLPNITLVPDGRRLMIETGSKSTTFGVRVKPFGSNVIKFLNGSIYLSNMESLSIYRFKRSEGVYEWRIDEQDGNFKTLGNIISNDNKIDSDSRLNNSHLLDGAIESKERFARIYNQFVLNLPISQVCNFDDWATGDNKYKFSLANSTNPAFANKFHFPDRRGLYEKNTTSLTKSADYQPSEIGEMTLNFPMVRHDAPSTTYFGITDGPLIGSPSNRNITFNEGKVMEVKNYSINKYILF